MGKKKKKIAEQERRKQEKLAWTLREWDCISLEQAIKLAESDKQLRLILVECGIQFGKTETRL
jgi:electron transfer flavoprotein alpha/beta subunit